MLFLSKRLGDITVNDIAEITPFVVLGLAVVCGICLMIIKIKEAENNALFATMSSDELKKAIKEILLR